MKGTDMVSGEHRVHYEGMEAELGEVVKSGKYWYVSTETANKTDPGGADSYYMGGFTYWKACAYSANIFAKSLNEDKE